MSNDIISAAIVQIAEDRDMNAVLTELLQAERSELYVRDLSEYLEVDVSSSKRSYRSFWNVALLVKRKNEIAVGYKPKDMSYIEAKEYTLNPPNKDKNTRSRRKGTELNTQARHVKPRALEVEQDHFEEPKRKRHNPFAKTRKESPAKTSAPQSPIKKSPGLSRMSTFSTQSRLRSKVAKEII